MDESRQPVQIHRALTEEEADRARHDDCPHYLDCLGQGLGYWICDPRCGHYIAPSHRTPKAPTIADMGGIASLLIALFPGFNVNASE
ncbi:MAG: hypothetical protein H7834_10600 [Magnetococcus sp. YQC-9]